MAEEIKQIKIGVIDLEKNSADILKGIKDRLEKSIQESRTAEKSAPASDTILQVILQIVIEALKTAGEQVKNEETQKVLAEIIKKSGYTVGEIQSVIESAKKAVENLPPSSSKLAEFVSDDIQKILDLGLAINKDVLKK